MMLQDVLHSLFTEGESARERRLTFRQLKRRYYAGRMSHPPQSFLGSVTIRGRSIRSAANFDLLVAVAGYHMHPAFAKSTGFAPFGWSPVDEAQPVPRPDPAALLLKESHHAENKEKTTRSG